MLYGNTHTVSEIIYFTNVEMKLFNLLNELVNGGRYLFRLGICLGSIGWASLGVSQEVKLDPIHLVLDRASVAGSGEESGKRSLQGSGAPQDQVNEIWVSSDLNSWNLWRTTQHNPFELNDLPDASVEGDFSSMFFKVNSYTLEQAKPWKNLVRIPGYSFELERYLEERFLSFPISYDYQPVSWIKFAIRWSEAGNEEVVFQDSKEYSFHYDFLKDNLTEFRSATRQEMDEITLFNEGRRLLLGSALFGACRFFLHADLSAIGLCGRQSS